MPFVEWTNSLALGVASIDEQHKRMLDIINMLHNSMVSGMSDECFAGLFDSLIDCTFTHFKHEEDFFAQTSYPGAEKHRQEHETLRRELDSFREDIVNRGDAEKEAAMMETLKVWFLNHLETEDKPLGVHLKALGIS